MADARSRSAALSRCRIGVPPVREMVTASSPSSSVRRTWTRSSAAVWMVRPTWSAAIGSSRCPRSTSTASRTARGRPRSRRASMAAAIVRPENSTSSTSTTTASSMRPGMRGAADVAGGVRAQVVAVHGDVEFTRPGRAGPRSRRSAAASRRARKTPRVGMPSSTRSSAPRLASRIWWAIRAQRAGQFRAVDDNAGGIRPDVGMSGAGSATQALLGFSNRCGRRDCAGPRSGNLSRGRASL